MTTSEASPSTRDATFFGHPRGLATLFFTEMWERFSFYGMRALLILYMTAAVSQGGLAYDAAKAGAIYALYTSSVYLLGLPGGWLADRLIGQRRAILWGGIIIAAGHFSMAAPFQSTFFIGLVLIVIGTGLLKPNISSVVGQLYSTEDERRDADFRSSIWGSTSERSPRRSSAAGSASASTGTSDSAWPDSAWSSVSSSTSAATSTWARRDFRRRAHPRPRRRGAGW
jgi:dipeptide/tripeptide permease